MMKMDPMRGEYAFQAGAHLGFKIRESLHPSLIRLRSVHELFLRAAEFDPTVDDGAPLRALGTLLIRSPPWPTGVGDIDEGTGVLEKSVEMFPAHPANHLYLALAYMEDKRFDDAEKSLNRALKLTKGKRFGVRGEHWRNEIKSALKKNKKERKKRAAKDKDS